MSQPELPTPNLRISALTMSALQFRRLGPRNPENVDMQMQMNATRPSTEALGVEISVGTRTEGAFELTIAYRCLFTRTTRFEEDEDTEEFWKRVASGVGPSVLFPYIRAQFSHVLNSAGIHGKLLPLIDPRNVFAADELEIPTPQAGVATQPETREGEPGNAGD